MEAVKGRVISNSSKSENIARENARKRRGIGLLAMAAASAVCLQMSHRALGATEIWTDGSGNWATAANWNSGAGPVPGAEDTVDITNADGTSRTITYNYTGSAITLGSLTIDNDGGGTNTLSMTSTGTSLAVGNEYLGDSNTSTLPGRGVLIQSVGTNAVSNSLFLGYGADDAGSYTFSSGVLSVAGTGYVGYGGSGTFTQSGGTASFSGQDSNGNSLSLGDQAGGKGVYNLITGNVSAVVETVGNYGSGTFNQTGGTNTVSTSVVLGVGSGSAGTYIQTGGTNTISGFLNLGFYSGSTGTYTLGTGATLSSPIEYVGGGGNGTFTQTGGTNTLSTNLYLGHNSGTNGVYSLSGTGLLSVAGTGYVGYNGTGTFTQSGGTASFSGFDSVGTSLYVGDQYAENGTGFYSLSGGNVNAAGSESIGNGTFNQTGGINTVGGSISLGANFSNTGTYNLGTGATLSSGEEYVGDYGNGTFNQTGGTNTISELLELGEMGGSAGSYTLGTGASLSSPSEYVGDGGNGTFNQTGDTNTVSDNVYLGDGSGGIGQYTLSSGAATISNTLTIGAGSVFTQTGGSLYASGEYVHGSFVQSGGTHTVGPPEGSSASLTISGSGPAASYSLSNTGELVVQGTVYVENGAVFSQSGGYASDGALSVDTSATYNLNGTTGMLESERETVGYSGAGAFNQGGNTTNAVVGLLYLGYNSGSSGTYTMTGGLLETLDVMAQEIIGDNGTGTFVQSGGTNNFSDGTLCVGYGASGSYSLSGTGTLTDAPGGSSFLYIGESSGVTGSFIQTGGSVSLAGTVSEIVGVSGSGTYSQSGGTNTIGDYPGGDNSCILTLGANAGSSGVYTLSAGTLSVSSNPYGNSSENIGSSGSGTFIQTGGDNTLGATTSLCIAAASGSTGSYSLSGTGTLSVGGTGYVGYSGKGTFTQSGGTASFSGSDSNGNSLSLGDQTGSQGVYNLSGGNVNVAHNAAVGNVGSGTFNQTGGTNSFGGNLDIGCGGTGNYMLSAGTLLAAGSTYNEIVGDTSSGTFTQSGGVNSMAGVALGVGCNAGVTGTYLLSGSGVIDNGEGEEIGGDGTFIQTGGTNSIGLSIFRIDAGGLYSLSAGTLNMFNGNIEEIYGTFNQSGGTNVLEGPLWLSGLYSLSGTGTLTVEGPSTGIGAGESIGGTFNQSGGTNQIGFPNEGVATFAVTGVYNLSGGSLTTKYGTINSGTINVTGGSANLGAITGTGTLNVGDASASVTASGLQQSSVTITSTGELTLTAGGATNAVNSLVIDSGGVFNLTSTKLIINYGSGSDPITTIAGYIKSGYNGGHWNGPGIMSTTAQTPTNGLYYGVGYADGKDNVVAGLSSGQIEVMYTLLGDANLDGLVNGTDFNILAANFNQSIAGWDQGDFDYDGLVNAADFNDLAANFNQSASGADVSAGDVSALDAFAAANGLSLPTFSVPEPASAVLMVMAGLGILRRRRRR